MRAARTRTCDMCDSLAPVLTGSGSEGLRLVRTLSTPARAPLSSWSNPSLPLRCLPCPAVATTSSPAWCLRCDARASSTTSRPSGARRGVARHPRPRARPHAADPRGARFAKRSGGHGHRHRLPVPRPHPARPTRDRTLYYVHGGGYMAPIDPFHVRYATRLADAIGARVVMPDYPLAPEHTWKDSHDALVDDAARWAGRGRRRAGRRLRRRRARAVDGAVDARPRSGAAVVARDACALGRPHHLDARDLRRRRDRPLAVHRQGAGVRRVVGGVGRRSSAVPRCRPRSATSPGCRAP